MEQEHDGEQFWAEKGAASASALSVEEAAAADSSEEGVLLRLCYWGVVIVRWVEMRVGLFFMFWDGLFINMLAGHDIVILGIKVSWGLDFFWVGNRCCWAKECESKG